MNAKNSEPAASVIWPTGTQKSNRTLHVAPGATVWVRGWLSCLSAGGLRRCNFVVDGPIDVLVLLETRGWVSGDNQQSAHRTLRPATSAEACDCGSEEPG